MVFTPVPNLFLSGILLNTSLLNKIQVKKLGPEKAIIPGPRRQRIVRNFQWIIKNSIEETVVKMISLPFLLYEVQKCF